MLSGAAGAPHEVTLYIFVSSHAVESNFGGQIAVPFDRPSRDANDARLVWRDQACHQRRGYPKVTPLSVEGKVGDREVLSRPRTLGRHLPRDELATQGLVMHEDTGSRQDTRWRITTSSGLTFAMHVTTDACVLSAADRPSAAR